MLKKEAMSHRRCLKSPGPMEKYEFPSPLDLKLESEKAGTTAKIAVLPSE